MRDGIVNTWMVARPQAIAVSVLTSDGEVATSLMLVESGAEQYGELKLGHDGHEMQWRVWGNAVRGGYQVNQLLGHFADGLRQQQIRADRELHRQSSICPECLRLPYGDDSYLCDMHINIRLGLF